MFHSKALTSYGKYTRQICGHKAAQKPVKWMINEGWSGERGDLEGSEGYPLFVFLRAGHT